MQVDGLLAFPVARPTPDTLLPSMGAGVGKGWQPVLFSWVKALFLQRACC